MCYKGKCLTCIPVENGCLALAIISAILTLFSLVACIVIGAIGIIATNEVRSHKDYEGDTYDVVVVRNRDVLAAGMVCVVTVIVGIASLIAFVFSVLLCNGICKRRPGQVKAYFIYGVVITILAALASLGTLCGGQTYPALCGIVGCVIYSLFLVLVHQTYHKLLEGAVYIDHERLVDNTYKD